MNNVRWKTLTNFTGRNGYMKCSGIELLPLSFDDKVMVSPITSRGDVGNCNITVPIDALPDVIKKLQSILEDHRK